MKRKMSILMLLGRLEQISQQAFRMPFTHKILVDQEEIMELLEKIKVALPEDLKEAEWIISEKDRLLAQAQEEARHLVKEAEIYAQKMLNESELIAIAHEKANRIINEGQKTAQEIKNEANAYADQVLAHIQDNLEKALRVIRKGREELNEGQKYR